MFGTTGGLITFRAALLASRGFAALSLAYFDYEDLSSNMNLQLEYFEVCRLSSLEDQIIVSLYKQVYIFFNSILYISNRSLRAARSLLISGPTQDNCCRLHNHLSPFPEPVELVRGSLLSPPDVN